MSYLSSSISARTASGRAFGFAIKISATATLTCGHAMDVSDNVAASVSLRWPVDLTSDPGAHISVRLLEFENVALESVMVVEPTVIANGTKAGEK